MCPLPLPPVFPAFCHGSASGALHGNLAVVHPCEPLTTNARGKVTWGCGVLLVGLEIRAPVFVWSVLLFCSGLGDLQELLIC